MQNKYKIIKGKDIDKEKIDSSYTTFHINIFRNAPKLAIDENGYVFVATKQILEDAK